MGSHPSISAAIERVRLGLASRQQFELIGAEGGLRGYVLAQLLADGEARGGAPIIYVAADDESAQAVAAETYFYRYAQAPSARGFGSEILVVPDVDVSPYADAAVDPRMQCRRQAAVDRILADGAEGAGKLGLIICSLRSLMRRVMPAEHFTALSCELNVGEELAPESVVAAARRAGYLEVDVVEDPGSFALRGGVMDIFVPNRAYPVRIEWFGDEVEGMRLFDPDTQRSGRSVAELRIHPVRECVGLPDLDLRTAVLGLADRLSLPSTRTRQVLDNLKEGVEFFGIEALAPVFHGQLDPLWQLVPEGAHWYVDDLGPLQALAERVWEAEASAGQVAQAEQRLVCEPGDYFCSPELLGETLGAAAIVGLRLDLLDVPEDGAEPEARDGRERLQIEITGNLKLRKRLEAARAQRSGEILGPLVEELRQLGAATTAVNEDEAQERQLAELSGATEQDTGHWEIVLVVPNRTQADRLSAVLTGYGVEHENDAASDGVEEVAQGIRLGQELRETRVRVCAGVLGEGWRSERDRVLVLGEIDIFGKQTKTAARARRRVGLASLSQLAEGDYVVHLTHGVGRYVGMKKMAVQGVVADFVLVEYAKGDKLYLPVHRISEIERYSAAGEGKEPKLDKMGGVTFAAKRKKVRADVRQVAEELLRLYAEREASQGHAFPDPGPEYGAFEATFPFEETQDQAAAISAVQKDLSGVRPMDRLVCGDVGFGKTEVALRAAFRVAMSGRQVAVLAPTTVLVQQHYLNFRERMSAFPIEVGCLNRFQSSSDRKRTIEGIKSGNLDVVIGTHRLLSKDLRFADLGLCVIDEEQRFGVQQKERFKRLKTEVDVLTLTATPIPRTLHMGLLGIREISMITTPPGDRLSVQTSITRHSDSVIEGAVTKEMARGGQVFYVVPRVMGIDEHARRIRELVPQARVSVAHGQMPGEMLEKTMLGFVDHEADVLVATTIIESGLDIPRANTMLIARADNFGLAQLYQLRGRIGRSKLRAHCYLMVNSLERLAEDAKRRLEAIVRNTELGSGFAVSSQDLEIRGAGDLLGKKQSGHIATIGFEAYARTLEEAVAELRGAPIGDRRDPELAFDIPAFLPDDYVADTGQRLDLYRRMSAARTVEELHEVSEEVHDRFGELPIEARHFSLVMACRCLGRELSALVLELSGTRFTVRMSEDTRLDPAAVARWVQAGAGSRRMMPGDRLVIQVPERTGEDCRKQLESCESTLRSLVAMLAPQK